MKRLEFSWHALEALRERELNVMWIERAIREPEWTIPDPRRKGVERRFLRIPEHGKRILRVVVVESLHEIRILTAFFDRRARRP
ncbi:DUF4258 domain-containing protein [Aurantimonas sp. A3-2-R12]|uniref:DUF4258 domain-containing protein n=1 Tax=Aurantimonas sp. A3-2-R12 TaxID=3114362 RepID=UPI002E175CCB|nr:DUF4258 domain-containing protein [Aurantimonas sp. A3-2-R12]